MARYYGLGALALVVVSLYAVSVFTAVRSHDLGVAAHIRSCGTSDLTAEDKRFCVQLGKATWIGTWPSIE